MTLMNLRFGVSTARDVWSGYLFVKNLEDKKYYADYNPAPQPAIMAETRAATLPAATATGHRLLFPGEPPHPRPSVVPVPLFVGRSFSALSVRR